MDLLGFVPDGLDALRLARKRNLATTTERGSALEARCEKMYVFLERVKAMSEDSNAPFRVVLGEMSFAYAVDDVQTREHSDSSDDDLLLYLSANARLPEKEDEEIRREDEVGGVETTSNRADGIDVDALLANFGFDGASSHF